MKHATWFVAAGSLLLARGASAEDDAKTATPAPPVDVPGFWTADELRRIDEGLDVLNVTRRDLGFQKRPIDDPFRPPVVNRILDEPLSIGAVAAAWDATAREGDPQSLLQYARETLATESKPLSIGVGWRPRDEHFPKALPAAVRKAWDALIEASGPATSIAFRSMKATARDELLAKAFRSQVEDASAAAPALSDADFLLQLPKVDRDWLLTSAESLASAVAAIRAELTANRAAFSDWRGTERIEIPRGCVVVSGVGDDVHPDDPAVRAIIDLGGNDTYARGACVDARQDRHTTVVIDLAGDDRYLAGNDLSFGGALGGVAVQWDCGGNDVYLGGNVSCGAGILGVGVLVDEGGNDTYRIKDFGQGAGAFGIGLLLEKGGHDLFHADLFGQGFASTWGCGMLVEMSGNDVYDAGGAHLHAPLWRDRFQSLSQGFSIGVRPDASGGVGVLVDVAGNDRYSADIYGQGASYWYSLGLLIDDDGHDTYALGQYGQGSGIHLSAGMLLDRAGQDSYYDANGVGMGGAHDYSVGFLVDRAGDDYYAGGGGAQGGALTNSVAMLIDDAGDDGYAATRDGTQGSATAARNTGGIGLLLDGAGADRYTETTRNGGAWTRDFVGAGLDEPTPPEKPSANAMAAAISKEDAAKRVETEGMKDGAWDLDALWKLVTQWEVGDNTVVMPIARERFFALGAPALDRAFEHLFTKDSLLTRAIEKTVVEFAATGRPSVVERLLAKTNDADKFVRKNSVAMLAALTAKEALPRLTEMLTTDAETTGGVLSALATLKTAPPAVARMLQHAKEPVAVQAAVCLGAVGDDAAITALVAALGGEFAFPVRLAAQDRLAALGAAAVPALSRIAAAASAERTARRNALRALGGTRSVDACASIESALGDADRFVRLSAMTSAGDLLKSLDAGAGARLAAAVDRARAAETDALVKRLVVPPAKK